MLNHQQKVQLAWIITILIIGLVFSLDPIPQPLEYHDFADQRYLFVFPNTLNVLSNLLFLFSGLLGIRLLIKQQQVTRQILAYRCYLVFFTGISLVAIGSGYYHIAPDNPSLVWDRLPMTIAFMALFASVIAEMLNRSFAERVLPVLLLIGISSVVYWAWTEQTGHGDLRFYALVQFLPVVLILYLLSMFTSPAHYRGYIVLVVIFYALSKFFEWQDEAIFTLTGMVSGHTLKHVAAAMATFMIYFMLKKRLENSSGA